MAAAQHTIAHLRTVAGGTLGAGAGTEIWSCGLNLCFFNGQDEQDDAAGSETILSGQILGTDDGKAALTALLDPAVAAWTYLVQFLFAQHAQMTYVKLNAVGINNRQANANTYEKQFAPIAGGAGLSVVPWSSGIVAEHRTNGRSRGMASHGRMQIPAPITVDPGTGLITQVGIANTNPQSPGSASGNYAHFIKLMQLQAPSAPTYGTWSGAILYTVTDGQVYKKPGVTRTPMAARIDSVYVSVVPGETRSRQSKLKHGGVSSPVTPA